MVREELIALAIRGALFVSLLLLMMPIERLWASRPRSIFRKGQFTDVVHFFVNPLGVRHALGAAFVGLEVLLSQVVPERVHGFFGGMPFLLQFGIVLLIGEFFTYWTHRLAHSWSFLWRFHAVHHSSKDVDWLSAHRQHPFDIILFLVAANIPAIALGFNEPLVVFVAVFHRAFVAFTHANTRLELRWLRWLVVTPRYHHHHHDRDAVPSNFAGLFPIFDVLFGTYHWPSKLPEHYGVHHRVSDRWIGQLLLPIVQRPTQASPVSAESSVSASGTKRVRQRAFVP